jgi:hypothetical protein
MLVVGFGCELGYFNFDDSGVVMSLEVNEANSSGMRANKEFF